jgi:hypothetical protein
MLENTQTPLPVYFTGKQFTLRIGETERVNATDFIKEILPDSKPPETAREFLNLLFSVVKRLKSKQDSANSIDVITLKTDIVNLKSENEILKAAEISKSNEITRLLQENAELRYKLENPKSEISNPQSETPADKSSISEDPLSDIRLFFLPEYRKAETDTIIDLVLNMKEAYDNTITGIMHNPLRLLEDNEYQALLNWDREIFLPGIENMLTDEIAEVQQLKGIYGESFDIKQLITSRHKFYLFWAFVQFDPAEKLEALIPGLSEAQKSELQEMRFPLNNAVINVLRDLILKATEANDDTTEHIRTEEEEGSTASGDGGTEGGKLIALNPTNTPQPSEDTPGGDGPQQ